MVRGGEGLSSLNMATYPGDKQRRRENRSHPSKWNIEGIRRYSVEYHRIVVLRCINENLVDICGDVLRVRGPYQ